MSPAKLHWGEALQGERWQAKGASEQKCSYAQHVGTSMSTCDAACTANASMQCGRARHGHKLVNCMATSNINALDQCVQFAIIIAVPYMWLFDFLRKYRCCVAVGACSSAAVVLPRMRVASTYLHHRQTNNNWIAERAQGKFEGSVVEY